MTREQQSARNAQFADSWPRSIDGSAARQEWGWEPSYDLATMTADMLEKLCERHARGQLYPP